jgi:hypothetical protein
MSEGVRRFVDRVARACAAARVLSDTDYGGGAEVLILHRGVSARDVEPADLVVSLDAPSRADGWAEHLVTLGELARKALVVVVRNPERPWPPGDGPAAVELAGVLWRVGRVRERVYLGMPALVAALLGEDVVAVPAGVLVRRTALFQAFVVDTSPRTPQARRRLRMTQDRRTTE